jgi:valyl-tRNA synthetase
MKFAERGLAETRGKFFGTIENVYRFMASYANIDGFVGSEAPVPAAERSELDQWILSRLNSTIALADQSLESYDCTRAARAMEQVRRGAFQLVHPPLSAALLGGQEGQRQAPRRCLPTTSCAPTRLPSTACSVCR